MTRSALALALGMALAVPVQAFAQDAAEPQADAESKTLDTVTVTGSRIKRSQVEGPAPVTVITGDQIKKEGYATVYDVLSTLTEATGTVEPDSQWGQHTSNASPLNLRNMGPGRSLLLINGHRAADYPLPYGGSSNFQNFGSIPSAAIERIEVLASGASAIYGSDAMAGVVNVILKKDYVGNQFRVKTGTSTRGGRDLFDISWSGGRTGEGWSLAYAAQYLKRDVLFAGERDFMDSENDAHPTSWSEADRARGHRFSDYYDTARISRLDNNVRISPPPGACDNPGFGGVTRLQDYREYNTPTHTLGPSLGERCAAAANFHNWTIQDGEESASIYAYGTLDFTDRTQGWASMMVYDSEGTSSIADFGMGYVPNVKWYDAGIGALVEGKRLFTKKEIGPALTRTDERAVDFAMGVKGNIADRFDWEASYDHADYQLKKTYPAAIPALVNAFLLGPQQGLTDASHGPDVPVGTPIYSVDLNHFFSPITGDDWRNISTFGNDRAKSTVDQAQLVFSGDLFQGWAGPISFAGVAEVARQSYELKPDPVTVPALGQGPLGPNQMNTPYASPYYGYDLGGGTRKRWAVGAEFRVPLWNTDTPGLGSADWNLAGRYDNYDQTLDNAKATWMTGLEWRPFDSLLIRGSYATNFRAPDMHYVYASGGQSFSQVIDGVRCFEQGRINQCGNTGGNEDPAVSTSYDTVSTRAGTPLLKYEEGESWTAGFVWDIRDRLSLSADYWNIEIRNAISNVDRGFILAAELGCKYGIKTDGTPYVNPFTAQAPTEEFCQSMFSRIDRNGPNGAITELREGPINKGGLRASGVDVGLRYGLDTASWGDFNFSLNYTNMLEVSGKESDASEWSDGKRGARDGIKTKLRASAGWVHGNFDSTLSMTRTSTVKSAGWGGCVPFDNGERGTPINDDDCVSNDAASVNFGQRADRYYGYLKAPVIFNLSAGYRFTENQKVNLYVTNLLDDVHKDPYKGDYVFTNATVWPYIGREVALEYVVDFK